MWSDQHRLLVMGQMNSGLAVGVGVFTKKAGVEIEVRHVAVMSRVGGHHLRLDEPAIGHGEHWLMLLVVVMVKVPGIKLTETSSALSVYTASLRDVKLIYVLYIRKRSSTRLVIGVIMVVDLRLH